MPTIDYYLFLLSPWCYIGTQAFNQVAAKHGATVNYKPIDVMSTFENMGGTPPAKRHPSRQRLRMDEMRRWSAHLQIPINLKPAHWPTDQSMAAKLVLAAGKQGRNAGPLSDSILAAVWRDEQDIADPATLRQLITAQGWDADALLQQAETPELAKQYAAATEEAHSRDVFGAPTFIYNDELFWGQDRIEFLDRALAAA